MADMFTRPAVCRQCGVVVLDEKQHQDFHDTLVKAFTERDKTIETAFANRDREIRRAFMKAGVARNDPRPARRPAHPVLDAPGGQCRSCGGLLTLILDEIPSRRSDHTVRYLLCLGCRREIRRG